MKHLKETFSLNCAVAAAGSFLAGGLIPLSMYIGNFREFSSILPGSMLLYALLGVSVCFVSIFFLLSVVALAGKRIYGYFIALFSALVIAVYAQGNVIGAKYPLLDGKSIPWDKMIGIGVVNTIIWIVIIGLGGAVYWKWKERSFPVLRTVMFAFFFFMVLTVGLRFATLKMPAPAGEAAYFSGKDFYKASSERNIFVFVIDSFEQSLLEELLKKDPSAAETLSDFTFYKNTLGKFPSTIGALPHILTGQPVNMKIPYEAYINDSMQRSSLVKNAQKLDYDLYFYVPNIFTPQMETAKKIGCLRNICSSEQAASCNIMDYFTVYQNSLFSYAPHFLKKAVLVDQFSVQSGGRFLNVDNLCLTPNTVSALIDNIPEKQKLSVATSRKVFKLYHLVGVHAPNFNLQTARKNIDYLKHFFAELKRLGIYEQSSIVIIGDHGVAKVQYPIFLYKNTKGGMKISKEPFSFDNLNSLLAGLLETPNAEPVFSSGQREFWVWYPHHRTLLKKLLFDLEGNIVISGETLKEKYIAVELTELEAEGMSTEHEGRWAYENAKLTIPLPAKFQKKDICLSLETRTLSTPQYPVQKIDFGLENLKLKTVVYNHGDTFPKKVKLFIPRKYNTKRQLTLAFSAWHYLSPNQMWGTVDVRSLSVLITGVEFSFPTEQERNFVLQKSTDTSLSAKENEKWSVSGKVSFSLPLAKQFRNKEIVLSVTVLHPFEKECPVQKLNFSVNGKELAVFKFDEQTAWTPKKLKIKIPRSLTDAEQLHVTVENKNFQKMTDKTQASFLVKDCKIDISGAVSVAKTAQVVAKAPANVTRKNLPRSFFAGENLVALLSEGLSDETTGRWTCSKKSSLTVPLKSKYVHQDLVVTFDTQTLLSKKFKTQSLTCYLGKEKLAVIKYQYPEFQKKLKISIPQKLHGGKDLKFVFETEHLRSPAQMYTGNPDERMLGVNLSSCRISKSRLPKWIRNLFLNK